MYTSIIFERRREIPGSAQYLRTIRCKGLDLEPIVLALESGRDRGAAEDVFVVKVDLPKRFDNTMAYSALKG